MTIQDRSYSSSLIDSFTNHAWFLLPTLSLLFLLELIVAAAIVMALFPSNDSFPTSLFLVTWIALSVLTLWWALRVYRKRGYSSYTGEDARARIRQELECIKAGLRGRYLGVRVFHCDDSTWRGVVMEALSLADVVVIDISEMTEHLEWELSAAAKLLRTHQIILAQEEGTDSGIGEASSGYTLFRYPSRQLGVGLRRRHQLSDTTNQLRIRIAESLFR